MEQPRVMMWKNQPVTELSRDELLVVVEWLGKALESERQMHRQTLEMDQLFAETRAALARR